MKDTKSHSNQNGFGLVEVLLIIVIIAILVFIGWFVWRRDNDRTVNTKNTSSITGNSKNNSGFTYYDCLDKNNGQPNSDEQGGLACKYQNVTYKLPDQFSFNMIRNGDLLPSSASSYVQTIAETLYNTVSAPTASPREPAEVKVISVADDKYVKLNESSAAANVDIIYNESGKWISIYKTNPSGIECKTIQQYAIPKTILASGTGQVSISNCTDSQGIQQSIDKYTN